MLYLYVKTHNKTGLRYLGYTTKSDPHKYKGSGKYWTKHLKKHGYDYSTIILLKTEDKNELKETGLFFSKLFNVVKSEEWANLKEETGANENQEEISKIVSSKLIGRMFSRETKEKMSVSATIRQTGKTNSFYGRNHSEESKKIIGEASKKRAKRIYNQRLQKGNHPNNNCVCPHCNKEGQYRAMKRWHFDNCKIIS